MFGNGSVRSRGGFEIHEGMVMSRWPSLIRAAYDYEPWLPESRCLTPKEFAKRYKRSAKRRTRHDAKRELTKGQG